MRKILRFAFLGLIVLGISHDADADLTFTSQIRADFEFEVVNGPLTQATNLPAGTVIPFQALGTMEFTLDDSNPTATTAAFLNATGDFSGVSPVEFLPFAINPYQFVNGDLTNIIRNVNGDITSGTISDLNMFWEMTTTAAVLGGSDVRMYGTMPLDFNGNVTNLPFSDGDQISGLADFEIFLDLGLGNPGEVGGDPLAVVGRNRYLTSVAAVPEPGSIACCMLLATGYGVWRRRKSRRS